MEGKKRLYSVGQMAKLCNVSPKQLRYYDENGILSPAHKDDQTLYRYYKDEQVQEVLLLKELKQMDISLKEISDILNERDVFKFKSKLRLCLDRARAELQLALNKYDRITELFIRVAEVAEILENAANTGPGNGDFQLIEVPTRRVVFTRYESDWNVEQYFTTDRRAELNKIMDEYELHPQSCLMAIFHGGYMHQFSHDPKEQRGDLEVLFAVDNVKDCPHTRKFGGFHAISAIHIGHYREEKHTYRMMQEWAKLQNLELTDVAVEEYINSVTMTQDESQLVTRLYIPLKNSSI